MTLSKALYLCVVNRFFLWIISKMFQILLRNNCIVYIELNNENTRGTRVDIKCVSRTRKRTLYWRFARNIGRFWNVEKTKTTMCCLVDRNVRAHWSREKITDYEHVLLRRWTVVGRTVFHSLFRRTTFVRVIDNRSDNASFGEPFDYTRKSYTTRACCLLRI